MAPASQLDIPYPHRPPDIYGRDGKIYANGVELALKGFNWFGSEGEWRVPFGLTERSADDLLAFAASNGFNALRLMFSWEDWAADEPVPASHVDGFRNPELVGVSYRSMLAFLVHSAARHGILVMLTCHRIRRSYNTWGNDIHAEWPGDWNGLWYDDAFPEERVRQLWGEVAARFCAAFNVFGVDLMNEPYSAHWGDGSAADWRAGSTSIGNAVLAACPRWLVVVQGTSNPGMWGENLRGVAESGSVRLSNQSKLAYSAHTYGPSLFVRSGGGPAEHWASDFPQNMPQVCTSHAHAPRPQPSHEDCVHVHVTCDMCMCM